MSNGVEIEPSPLVVLDVQYTDTEARAAAVVAARWTDAAPIEERVTLVSDVKPYRPGAFFERELPCLLAVLALLRTEVRAIVIDGYVELDEHGKPGLGGHLHAHYQGSIPVVGVAKTAFRGSAFATQVLRGTSRHPLFVTSRGIDPTAAAELVKRMHGPHRIPTLLQRTDHLARGPR
jgi:deoxyribonuclease V